MSEVRWLNEREERAWRSLQLMQMRLNAQLARDLAARSELSYQDYMVLVALTAQPEGRMRLFELGHQLGWEKSRLSHQVTRMADRGLVEKLKCPSDLRGAVVGVSARGRDEISAAAPGHLEAVRRLFVDLLAAEQLDTVAEVCERVLAAVAEEELRTCPPCTELTTEAADEASAVTTDGNSAVTAGRSEAGSALAK
jgi:DNA-binding MarR family transcriptional regulator